MLRHASKPLCAEPKNGCCGMLRHSAACCGVLRLHMLAGEYTRNVLSLPPPKMAPQESNHFGHINCINTPPSHKHGTIKSTRQFTPTS